jgi:hypothetical protein
MAIFANGPATQTTAVTTTSGTATALVFNTTATGVSGTLRNVLLVNAGTVTAYFGGGTTVTSTTGFPVAAGSQLLLEGPAINIYGLTASGTTTIIAGLSTQTVAD